MSSILTLHPKFGRVKQKRQSYGCYTSRLKILSADSIMRSDSKLLKYRLTDCKDCENIQTRSERIAKTTRKASQGESALKGGDLPPNIVTASCRRDAKACAGQSGVIARTDGRDT